MPFIKKDILEASLAPFRDIGENWGILSAGTAEKFNSMTVSWGAAGVLWSVPCVFVFVRPQRYTFEFTEKNDRFSLSLMPEGFHKKMAVFGSTSGRDTDKYARSGFTAEFCDGVPYTGEAQKVFICRKIASADITPEWFIEHGFDTANYPAKDYHRMYIGEVEAVLQKADGEKN